MRGERNRRWRYAFGLRSGLPLFAAVLGLAGVVRAQEAPLAASCSLVRVGQRATISLNVVNRGAAAVADVRPSLTVSGDPSADLDVVAEPRPWRELLPGKRVILRWSAALAGEGHLEVSAGATAAGAGGARVNAGPVACGAVTLEAPTPPPPTRTPAVRRTRPPTATPRATRTPIRATLRPTRTPRRTSTARPTRTPPPASTFRPTRTPLLAGTSRPTRTRIPAELRTRRPTATSRPTRTPRPPEGRALDDDLLAALRAAGVTALDPGPRPDPAKVALGRALMFDKLLSGNRDISCATCHHPTLAIGDSRSLAIGTGGVGLGPARRLGAGRAFIPRNAIELFNRGVREWRTMLWDMRVSGVGPSFRTPAGRALPFGLDSVLAAQAMFPIVSREEMRGLPGDRDVFGAVNELAVIADDDFPAIWDAVMARILAVPAYVEMFARAYPGVAVADLGFEHAANALAAFEIEAFTLLDSPWDRFLGRADRTALSDDAKRGALLFYGAAGCATCHSGNLLTDQRSHVLAVPQVGPGKGAAAPLDFGRGGETGSTADRFAFRTPPLRNVAVTGPWTHDGAFVTLEGVVRHHLEPATSLREYDVRQLDPQLWGMLRNDAARQRAMLDNLAPQLGSPRSLSDEEVNQILAFLEALTDPAALNLVGDAPRSVPSGLPVGD